MALSIRWSPRLAFASEPDCVTHYCDSENCDSETCKFQHQEGEWQACPTKCFSPSPAWEIGRAFHVLYMNAAAMLQTVQALYEQAQASYDPNQLLQLIALHPYHPEALNAASDLYRHIP